MLALRDTPGGSWGFSWHNDLDTASAQLSYGKNITKCLINRTDNAFSILLQLQNLYFIPVLLSDSRNLELDYLRSLQKPLFEEHEVRVGSSDVKWTRRITWVEKSCGHEQKLKPIISNPYIGKSNLGFAIGYQPENPQNEIDKMPKELTTYNKQISANLTSGIFKTTKNNEIQNFFILVNPSLVNRFNPSEIYLFDDCIAEYSTETDINTYITNMLMVFSSQIIKSEYTLRGANTFYPILAPFFVKPSIPDEKIKEDNQKCSLNSRTRLSSMTITLLGNMKYTCVQTNKDKAQNIDEHYLDSYKRENVPHAGKVNLVFKKFNTSNRELLATSYERTSDQEKQDYNGSFLNFKSLFGPYGQIHAVYNVTETKDKSTSQQFKQRSQGIGSGSVSGGDNSSTPAKRRTIKIESSCSFSVEFKDRGKGSTVSASPVSSSAPETGSKKGKEKKKALHRCVCTTSFPTNDKKLKNKPCDSGVCIPGECSPSECFKRLQQKYGSISKTSDSDVSSSQASQTKKKAKDDKKTLKETGSPSISTYKETVEETIVPPPKKEPCMAKCCRMLKFWKKDKPIALKPGVMGTDISLKEPKKEMDVKPSKKEKKGKKAGKEDDKGKTVEEEPGKKDAKVTKKKKKDKTAKTDIDTEKIGKIETKDTKTGKTKVKDTKKAKKDKTAKTDIDKEKIGKIETKDSKKGKTKVKDTKKAKKEGPVPDTGEVKTETKGTGKNIKMSRPLKPYECEPGVCTPGVCSPKECYDRKFPPPPPPPPKKQTMFIGIKNCCLKVCCKRKAGVEKVAATQSHKVAPEITPGAPVYQEKGTSGRRAGRKRGEKTSVMAPQTVYQEKGTSKPKVGKKRGEKTSVIAPEASAGAVPSGDASQNKAYKKQSAGYSYFQSFDRERGTVKQGVNIGSDCECSVEFYKMLY